MRKLLIAAMTAGLLTVAAPALADHADTTENDNNVHCGTSTWPGANTNRGVQVKSEGDASDGSVVVCNDGSSGVPVEGRIIVSTAKGQTFASIDGDRDNPDEAQGWARVDMTPAGPFVRCGGRRGGGYDSAHPTAGASGAYCAP